MASDTGRVSLTGRGVRIAIIDSGVHPDHSHIDAARIAPGASVLRDGSVESSFDGGTDVVLDRLGHGTAVTAAIQEKAPDAICIPIRVFHDALKASAASLIGAIDWAIGQRADIINLSLGSPNLAHAEPFAQAVERARSAGIAIVAAREAEGTPCFPGSLDGVIGVGVDWDCPRERFRIVAGERAHFLASGYPRPIPGVPPRRNLFGISFATAQISGFAAQACEGTGQELEGGERVAAVRAALAGMGEA